MRAAAAVLEKRGQDKDAAGESRVEAESNADAESVEPESRQVPESTVEADSGQPPESPVSFISEPDPGGEEGNLNIWLAEVLDDDRLLLAEALHRKC